MIDRRTFCRAAGLSLGLSTLSLSALGQVTAGRDYLPIEPAQPGDAPGKIEVIEFFSYGCPHCNEFHPLITQWAARLPAEVNFRRVPVGFGRAQWLALARLYHAADAIGELKRLDDAAFKAIHGQGARLYDEKSITEWAAQQGVDKTRFGEAFRSFGVNSKAQRGDVLAQVYKIGGVPAIAVDGRYLVQGQNYEELLANADKLVAKARRDKGAGKK